MTHTTFNIQLCVLALFWICSGCGTTKPKANKGLANLSSTKPQTESYERGMSQFIDASVKLAQGYPDDALRDLQAAIQTMPDHAASAFLMAKIYAEKKDYVNAERYAQTAIQSDPNIIWYYSQLSTIQSESSNSNGAINTLEKAVKRFPKDIDLKIELAELYLKITEYNKALAIYNDLETQSGMMEQVLRRKIDIYQYLKQNEAAITELNKLIAAIPNNNPYYYQLYDLLLALNRKDEAMRILEQLKKEHPNDPMASFKLIEYYQSTNRKADAISTLKSAFANPLLQLEPKVHYLIMLLQQPEYSSERPLFQELAHTLYKQNPNSAIVLTLKGDIFNSLGIADSARHYFKRSLVYHELNQQAWEAVITKDIELNLQDSLLMDSEKALEVFPNNPRFIFYNAVGHQQKMNYKKAISGYEKYLKFSTSSPGQLEQAYINLGECYFQTNEFSKSYIYFDKALGVNPNNPLTLNNYAYRLAERGEQLEKALSMSQQLITSNPNQGQYADTHGWVLFKLNRLNDAQTWLEKAYQLQPTAVIADHLGDLYYQLGKPDIAVNYWKEAKTKGLNNDNIQQKINQRRP
jgi:tetratricopeptide (TPR) repeat protein